MKVTWYGTASLRLECANGRVLIDPYIRGYGESEKKLKQIFGKETVIAVTHGHFDHIAHLYEIYGKRKDLKIYTTETPAEALKQDGMEPSNFKLVRPGEQFLMNGFSAKILQGRHIQFDKKLVLKTLLSKRMILFLPEYLKIMRIWNKYDEHGEILFWEFEAEKKRVQVLGSAALDEKTEYPIGADLLALAYQGRSDLQTYIQPIIRRLQPKCIMPIHFDDAFPPISSEIDMYGFEKMMQQHFPQISYMIPQLDVAYEI